MKHLLYLLLAGSLLTEQPLYGAKKKRKKTRKIGKKEKIGKKGGASSVAATTSQPLTPTPIQTTKTEAPQTAIMTKQQAQKLIDGYLEKYKKEILVPTSTLFVTSDLMSKSNKLKTLVENIAEALTGAQGDVSKKIENLITIFDNKNSINISNAKELKTEFNTIVVALKEDLPKKIKENKTEEQTIVKALEKQISDNLKTSMVAKNDSERKKLQTEMAELQKEKKIIEEGYRKSIETILTIHKAALSLLENDILKDFLEKLIKEDSAKQSKEAYNKAKETRYLDKIKNKKEELTETRKQDTKEAITVLKEKLKDEKDEKKQKELSHQIMQLKLGNSKKAPLKYGEKSKETSEKIDISEQKKNLENIKDTLKNKLDEVFWKAIEKLDKTRDTLKSSEELKKYVKTVLQKTLEIDENKMISNEISKKRLKELLTQIAYNEQTNLDGNESLYTKILAKIITEIEALDLKSISIHDKKKSKEEIDKIKITNQKIHKKIYDIINSEITQKIGKDFFKKDDGYVSLIE